MAAANRTTEGLSVKRGEAIALVDSRLVAAASAIDAALFAGLDHCDMRGASLITVFAGREVADDQNARLREAIAERYPGVEVEAVRGDQPLYPLIASIES
jgi:dihydroxyacetone kinase-like predicted kinase